MKEILISILSISVLIGIPATTFVIGLNFGRPNLNLIKGNFYSLLIYSIAMFIVMPAIALILIFILPEYFSVWTGLFLISIAPSMPLIVDSKNLSTEYSNISLAWFVTALLVSIVFIPLNITIAEYILKVNVDLAFLPVLTKMMILFIIPLSAGFLVNYFLPDLKIKLIKILGIISKIALSVLILIFLIISIPLLIKAGFISIMLILFFIIAAYFVGKFFGMFSGSKSTLLLQSSLILRFPAPALVFAQLNGTIEKHAPVIVAYTLLGILLSTVIKKFNKPDTEK